MVNEIEVANEILSIIQNLDDAEEAKEYVRLYLKSYIIFCDVQHEEIDENAVLRNIRDVDSRI